MDREQAKTRLQAYAPVLKAIGVLSASLFGSVGRDDAGPDSDVDVVVRLSDNFSKGGLDYFGCLEELQQRLSVILGCKVDVIEEPVRKARLQAEIESKPRPCLLVPSCGRNSLKSNSPRQHS